MSEYTPTTADVRNHYAYGCGPEHTWGESREDFNRWLAGVRAEAFSEGVNFIDSQPGPWGAGVVAGRAEAARRRAEAEGVIDL